MDAGKRASAAAGRRSSGGLPRAAVVALLRRYLAADLAGWACSVAVALALHAWTSRVDAIALGATLAENAGFYGVLLLRELGRARRSGRDLPAAARALALELVPAEALDTFLVRPLLVALVLSAVEPVAVAVTAGGLLADGVFYAAASACRRLSGRA